MSQTLTYVMGGDRRAHVDNIQDFKVDFSDDNHNWVQARQFERGMRQVFVNVTNEDGTPFDLTGCNVWFEGLLPKTADGDFRVIDKDGYVPLDQSAGKFRFDMPGNAFTVAGSYRQAFFRIVKNGNSVTTLEFDLDVLADKVIDGLVPKTWIGPFEEIADKLVDSLQKHIDDADKIVADFQQKVTDLVNQLNQQGSTTTSMLTELQNRITDLEDKIKSEHLFTEDEAKAFEDQPNDKLANVETETQRIEKALTGTGFMVNDYGAKADGETDDTSAIQKAIDAFANSKSNKLVFSGTYKVSKADADSDKRAYALKLAALSNRTIDLTNAKFKTDLVDDFPNIFAFYNCKDIYVVGGYAEAVNFNLTKGHLPYYGSFVYAKGCTNLNVYRTSTFNMMYDVCIMDSQDGVISGNHFAHNLNEKNVHDYLPLSAIILYNGVNYNVTGNSIIGGLRDGDLSVFGGASYGNIVSGNHLKALVYYSEGITVDGGACKTIVSNNSFSGGYNFAIDVKFNSENTLVANNTIEKCVVAISDRGGEIDPKAQVFETVIRNNNIIFGGLPVDTQQLGAFGYTQIGLDIENQFTSDISGNHFTLGKGYNVNYKIAGILLSQPNLSLDYISPAAVIGNFFEFKNGINASYQIAGEGSVEVQLTDMFSVNLSNNEFKEAGNNVTPVKILGNNNVIKISANYFLTNGEIPVQCDNEATCNNLIITNDNYSENSLNITNAKKIQISTLHNHQSYITQEVEFSENTTEPFLIILPKWNTNTIIRVNAMFDASGTFVLNGTYKIETNNNTNTITVHAINTNNTDVVLYAAPIAKNIYGLVARATRPTKSADDPSKPCIDVYTEILDAEYDTSFE